MMRHITTTRVVGTLIVLGVVLLGQFFPVHTGPTASLRSSDKLRLLVFDVGQGDAILVQTPSGDDILIDGGPDHTVMEKLGRALPPGDRDIELLVLTHPHADHLVGLLEVLRRYEVRRVLVGGATHTTRAYEEWERLIHKKNLSVTLARAGQTYSFGRATFEVIFPMNLYSNVLQNIRIKEDDLNDASVVMRLTYVSSTALLPGDATERVEELLLETTSTLRADLLKVGHHGSRFSTLKEFINRVGPKFAIISVGAKNTYGHPAYKTLRRLQEIGAQIFRTDLNGDIEATTDGTTWSVVPTRP